MEEKDNERRAKPSVMADNQKHRLAATATTSYASVCGGDSLLERIPELILDEILSMLEPNPLTTLCSLACVSRSLESSVNRALASLSSLDLSQISLDSETFDGIITTSIERRRIKSITLDCLRLNDSSIISLLGPELEELILLKCSSLSYKLIATIGMFCPNLRILTLEFSGFNRKSEVYDLNFRNSFVRCQRLESLKIKIRGGEVNDYAFMLLGIYQELPQTVKVLKLQPASALDTILLLKTFTPLTFGRALTHISLVIDTISDPLIHNIAHCLPQLLELDLKDQSTSEPSDDLSNLGIQSLVNCKRLTSLSILRSRHHVAPLFKRVNDMGMFLLSEGCKRLESVRFGGFSKVSDAGFTSVLNSSLSLKKFEIQNGYRLTDLSFQDFSKGSRSLVEVKLVSCNSITSDAVCELATCSSLEVIDLLGCKSVSDSCLDDVSRLTLLTTLNLGGTDVTDGGMGVLGKGNAPISCLSLRGCKRVTDEGIISLLISDGKITKALSSLDLGHMPEVTNKAITTIVDACAGLIELSIRNCVRVTDASVEALGLKGRVRRLDLYKCGSLCGGSFRFLKKPFCRGLQWIGIGGTRLVCVGDEYFDEVRRERPWLTICKDGCEVGCHDGWQFHEF